MTFKSLKLGQARWLRAQLKAQEVKGCHQARRSEFRTWASYGCKDRTKSCKLSSEVKNEKQRRPFLRFLYDVSPWDEDRTPLLWLFVFFIGLHRRKKKFKFDLLPELPGFQWTEKYFSYHAKGQSWVPHQFRLYSETLLQNRNKEQKYFSVNLGKVFYSYKRCKVCLPHSNAKSLAIFNKYIHKLHCLKGFSWKSRLEKPRVNHTTVLFFFLSSRLHSTPMLHFSLLLFNLSFVHLLLFLRLGLMQPRKTRICHVPRITLNSRPFCSITQAQDYSCVSPVAPDFLLVLSKQKRKGQAWSREPLSLYLNTKSIQY